MSYLRTATLMLILSGLMAYIGRLFANTDGMLIAVGVAVAWSAFVLWFGAERAIALTGAKPAGKGAAEAARIVADLAARAEIPAPPLYVMASHQPNAMSAGFGPGRSVLILTTALLKELDPVELTGVIAHELGHIKNRDAMTMQFAGGIVGVIVGFAGMASIVLFALKKEGGLPTMCMVLCAPLLAAVLRLGIGRGLEYDADRTGAQICGSAEPMIAALTKLAEQEADEHAPVALAPMFFVSPLPETWFAWLFDTHPPIEQRIARLRRM